LTLSLGLVPVENTISIEERSSFPENSAINYMPTTNVPKIDSIKIITIKTKSNKPSIILSNIVSSVITNADVS
jgi:hypothetical protein